MISMRRYGEAPFKVAVVHGGPGAQGSMAPVARELSASIGTMEPLQTATTIEGQVEELCAALEETDTPVVLIGHSWGAWLSWLLAAQRPSMVRELIMVGSGPFEERYAADIMATRLGRLSPPEKERTLYLMGALNGTSGSAADELLDEFGSLMSKTDGYDPITKGHEIVLLKDVFLGVSAEMGELRRSGRLLDLGKKIECPVLAVHGDYDPHPYQGVKEPLSKALADFRFVLLGDCGHEPWNEKRARDAFFEVLRKEIAAAGLV